jgi:hypothetical protein
MEVTMTSLPASTGAPRRGLWRWTVALLATVLMVVAGSGLVAFAQSGAGASRGPAFVPADAPIYVEGRLDMPAGQDQALSSFLSAFPGFNDGESFMMKVQEALDALTADASSGTLSYTEDLAPFLTGEVGIGVLDLAAVAASDGDIQDILIGAAVSDTAAAAAFLSDVTSAGDSGLSEESYGGSSILSGDNMALSLTGDWILLAPSVDVVKQGIDAVSGTSPSLADDPDFAQAWTRVPAGHLGAVYFDFSSFGPLLEMATQAAADQSDIAITSAIDLGAIVGQLPTDMVAYVAAEDDRITVNAFITPSELTPAMPVGESDLAARFPANTQLYVETRELGTTLGSALGTLMAAMDEETAAQMAPLEDMLGVPLTDYLDFVSDAAVGAAIDSDGLWLGMAAEVSDEAVAADRVERILSIVRLVGAGMAGNDGPAITVDEKEVAGTTVTEITLPLDDMSGTALPIPSTISVAVADGMMYLGLGDYVETALTLAEADSLAASPGYVDAIGADTTNSGVIYANLGSLLGFVDPMLSAMSPEWAQISPYAASLDRFIAVGTTDQDVISARMSIIAAPPAE